MKWFLRKCDKGEQENESSRRRRTRPYTRVRLGFVALVVGSVRLREQAECGGSGRGEDGLVVGEHSVQSCPRVGEDVCE